NQNIKFDTSGYLLFLSFILAAQLWVWMISSYPLTHLPTWLVLMATALFLHLYVRSANKPDALLDLGVFRSALFNRSSLVIFLRSVARFGAMFYLTFLLWRELGYTKLHTVMLILANAMMVLVTRPLSRQMADNARIRNITLF